MPSNRPLFASDRPTSTTSVERAAQEDDALLGNHQKGSKISTKPSRFWREVALFSWAVLATAAAIVLAVFLQHQSSPGNDTTKPGKPHGKRNLIFMVSDGMGPTSLSLTRSYRQYQEDLPIDDVLVLDRHFIGSSRTRSSNSLITDSAAGATAFSCGKKTYNGAISVLPDHTPCGTVLEAAKRAGYMTGLVVTTSITDATPACFASHVNLREDEDLIAQQEVGHGPLGRVLDLMLGGGRCHFLPNTTRGSCRADDQDITKMAEEVYGWTYIDNRKDFDDLEVGGSAAKLPLMGLFSGYNIPYEIDRRNMDDVYPSLDEMTRMALAALEAATEDSEQGFFLMIEGSRIDHAGHANDPATQVHEVLAYDKAFASVLEFLERSEVQGVVVASSDHETGGLVTARQIKPPPSYPHYLWYPAVLANASHSSEHLARALNAYLASVDTIGVDERRQFINEVFVQKGLGIIDATDDELDLIVNNPRFSVYYFADMISRRAQIGWSTHGHSAVDVNIYGTAGSDKLRGNHENTEIGKFLREYLEVDVDAITGELNEKLYSFDAASGSHLGWTGRIPSVEDLQELSRMHEESMFAVP